jgi:hypothetical protein
MEMVRIAANEGLSSDGNTTIERKHKLMPPISLVDMLQATGGGWAVCLPGLWSLPFVSSSLPFLGAFFL